MVVSCRCLTFSLLGVTFAADGSEQLGSRNARGGLDVWITDYGAQPGSDKAEAWSLTLCTEAFAKATAAIAAAGGGVLRVPRGLFFTGPFNLTSHMVLWLAEGAIIRADTESHRLPVLPALPSYGPAWGRKGMDSMAPPQADWRDAIPRYQALLYATGVENVTITGENGTIDGHGEVWWERWLREPLFARPHIIQLERSRDIRLYNVTLRDPGFWTVHLWRCEYVEVRYVTILVPYWPSVRPTNTDGINPDSSSHVLIEDSYLQTGDDAIAVKSGWDCWGRREHTPATNVTIRRVTVRQTEGNNAAGVAIGSEMSGGVDGIIIEDCIFIHVGVAVEVKVGTVRGGYVRNVLAQNLVVETSNRAALVVMATYPEQSPFCDDVDPPVPSVSSITYQRVRITGRTRGPLVQLQGVQTVKLSNIIINNVTDVFGRYGYWTCSHVSGKAEGNDPSGCRVMRQPKRDQSFPKVEVGGSHIGTVLWRNDGRCGHKYPLKDGSPTRCPTREQFMEESTLPSRRLAEPWLRESPCCSEGGWCGGAAEHCECVECIDYSRPRNELDYSSSDERIGLGQRRASLQNRLADAKQQQRSKRKLDSSPGIKGKGSPNLLECQGDCDGDNDCNGNLRCFQRDGVEPVPGCSGVGVRHWDYCSLPLSDEQSASQLSQESLFVGMSTTAPPRHLGYTSNLSSSVRGSEDHDEQRGDDSANNDSPGGDDFLKSSNLPLVHHVGQGMPPVERDDEDEFPSTRTLGSSSFCVSLSICGYLMKNRFVSRRTKMGFLESVLIFAMICFSAVTLNCLWFMSMSQSLPPEVGSAHVPETARPDAVDVAVGDESDTFDDIDEDEASFRRQHEQEVERELRWQRWRPVLEDPEVLWEKYWREEAEREEASVPFRNFSAASSSTTPSHNSCKRWRPSATSSSLGLRAVTPLDLGAKGDGLTDDTVAVVAALEVGNRCGVQVSIGPAGKRFLVTPGKVVVTLHNVVITFEGRLVGPSIEEWNPHHEGWPVGSCAYGESGCDRTDGRSPEFARSQWNLLHLKESSNVVLKGPGGLSAPGVSFWRVRNRNAKIRGYCLLKLERSERMQLTGLRLQNSPMYQLVVQESRLVSLDELTLQIDDNSTGEVGPHNTDGVSIIASQEVYLRKSRIESGDDNVVIKEGSRLVSAEHLTLVRGKGISIGSLGEQGSSGQVVVDVSFRNVRLERCMHGARIKTWLGGRGVVRNISFEDFYLGEVHVAVLIDQKYCPLSQRPEGCGDDIEGNPPAVTIRNVRFHGFSGVAREAKRIECRRCTLVHWEEFSVKIPPPYGPDAIPWNIWSRCDCCCPSENEFTGVGAIEDISAEDDMQQPTSLSAWGQVPVALENVKASQRGKEGLDDYSMVAEEMLQDRERVVDKVAYTAAQRATQRMAKAEALQRTLHGGTGARQANARQRNTGAVQATPLPRLGRTGSSTHDVPRPQSQQQGVLPPRFREPLSDPALRKGPHVEPTKGGIAKQRGIAAETSARQKGNSLSDIVSKDVIKRGKTPSRPK